jgi:hypothetical protein
MPKKKGKGRQERKQASKQAKPNEKKTGRRTTHPTEPIPQNPLTVHE